MQLDQAIEPLIISRGVFSVAGAANSQDEGNSLEIVPDLTQGNLRLSIRAKAFRFETQRKG